MAGNGLDISLLFLQQTKTLNFKTYCLKGKFKMDQWTQIIIAIIGGILGSTGLWSYLTKHRERKDAKTKLLIAISHDRIIWLGGQYIERGYITQDEYENLHDYLYESYSQAGGNGSAKRIMEEVNKLPIRNHL